MEDLIGDVQALVEFRYLTQARAENLLATLKQITNASWMEFLTCTGPDIEALKQHTSEASTDRHLIRRSGGSRKTTSLIAEEYTVSAFWDELKSQVRPYPKARAFSTDAPPEVTSRLSSEVVEEQQLGLTMAKDQDNCTASAMETFLENLNQKATASKSTDVVKAPEVPAIPTTGQIRIVWNQHSERVVAVLEISLDERILEELGRYARSERKPLKTKLKEAIV